MEHWFLRYYFFQCSKTTYRKFIIIYMCPKKSIEEISFTWTACIEHLRYFEVKKSVSFTHHTHPNTRPFTDTVCGMQRRHCTAIPHFHTLRIKPVFGYQATQQPYGGGDTHHINNTPRLVRKYTCVSLYKCSCVCG